MRVLDSIKAKSIAKAADEAEVNSTAKWEKATGTPAWEQAPKATADVQSNKLKQLLGQIKKA